MILVVDNYDSFVGNVARYFRELGEAVNVVRNDAISVNEIQAMEPRAIVISPGPCSPKEAGVSNPVVAALSGRIPILGICLGHQCIGDVMGARVVRAKEPMHGRASLVSHTGTDVFRGLPNPLKVGRYHSLIVEIDDPEGPLVVTARSEKGEVMGLAHREHPTFGVQFHPESILTEGGHAMLANFLNAAAAWASR
ncbi:anthranilate synthase component II [Chthonobacter albigriseus]|uniref:anthranilate synthase component II n=1 Tax=Chthonobacter albigriseus TaxID=1683161 RepID=UPI0015EE5C82|nr:aminodeoxychorismate/anthranilate synthase component II [Chthonobacter albigriseus]